MGHPHDARREAQLIAGLDGLPFAAALFTSCATPAAANARWAAIFGVDRFSLHAGPMRIALPAAIRDLVHDGLHAMQPGTPGRSQVVPLVDRGMAIELHISCIDRGLLFVSIADEDHRAHRTVRPRQEQPAKASDARDEAQLREQRLATIGQLTAGIMHDLNNALNPILTAAYLLGERAESPEAVRTYAERIRLAAETAAATTARVGRFIRQAPEDETMEDDIDLSVLAAGVLDLLEPVRRVQSGGIHAVTFVRDFAPDVRTRGQPGELREALLNLVQNAVDAMPEGGSVTLHTRRDGTDACLSVRDTGIGMTEEVQARVFEPFFTTKGANGTGLGLAEVYGIVRRHQGTVTVTSAPGMGTEVLLRLPCGTTMSVADESPGIAPPMHILIVEDHDDSRQFLRELLTADGHAVDVVATCLDARAHLATSPSAYDFLLTDIGLPDGDGWTLVKDAKAAMPGLRVGVITGWEHEPPAPRAVNDVEFVVRKPLRATDLKAHLAGTASPTTTAS